MTRVRTYMGKCECCGHRRLCVKIRWSRLCEECEFDCIFQTCFVRAREGVADEVFTRT